MLEPVPFLLPRVPAGTLAISAVPFSLMWLSHGYALQLKLQSYLEDRPASSGAVYMHMKEL